MGRVAVQAVIESIEDLYRVQRGDLAVTEVRRVEVATFGAVRLTVDGRDCVCDVTEVADACPVVTGQVPLELMDFVVDSGRRTLVGNPAHGGEHMLELL
jgi:hypothetical protein